MAKMKTRFVSLAEIKVSFFVRTCTNSDHVRYLQSLIESGAELPSLEIAEGSMDLIDGRHRLLAYSNLGYTEVMCNEKKYESRNEMILAALKANVGGSLPPSSKDISHVIECLLAEKVPRASIIRQISEQVGFPPKLVRRHIDDIQSLVAKRRLAEAVSAIASGDMNLNEAAVKYDVNVESLKAEISGKPKGESCSNIAAIKTRLSKKFETFNHSIGKIMANIRDSLRDGVISERDAEEIILHYTELLKGYQSKETQWKARFEKLFEVKTKNDGSLLSKKSLVKNQKASSGTADSALKKMGLN